MPRKAVREARRAARVKEKEEEKSRAVTAAAVAAYTVSAPAPTSAAVLAGEENAASEEGVVTLALPQPVKVRHEREHRVIIQSHDPPGCCPYAELHHRRRVAGAPQPNELRVAVQQQVWSRLDDDLSANCFGKL